VLGENLYAASISGCQNAAPQNTTPRSKKLGLIGGRTHANVADAQGERNKSYQDAQRGKTPESDTRSDGLETPSPGAREVAVDNHHEEAPQRSAILTSTSKKARGRFGVIGGKKKNSEGKILDTHLEAALSPSPHYRPNSEQGNEEKPKISPERATLHDEELGELPSKYSDPTMVRGSPKSISRNESTLQRPATPPAENSQDRADKKRVELKRLLDEKAKAPTVKKRKF